MNTILGQAWTLPFKVNPPVKSEPVVLYHTDSFGDRHRIYNPILVKRSIGRLYNLLGQVNGRRLTENIDEKRYNELRKRGIQVVVYRPYVYEKSGKYFLVEENDHGGKLRTGDVHLSKSVFDDYVSAGIPVLSKKSPSKKSPSKK
jgi:hypothetical protein